LEPLNPPGYRWY